MAITYNTIEEALQEAHVTLDDITAIAVTASAFW